MVRMRSGTPDLLEKRMALEHPSSEKQLLVTVRATVTKQVTVEGCTEDEAAKDPFRYAVDEMETEQIDWEVIDVRESP